MPEQVPLRDKSYSYGLAMLKKASRPEQVSYLPERCSYELNRHPIMASYGLNHELLYPVGRWEMYHKLPQLPVGDVRFRTHVSFA